jgi:hypothetical protein
MNCVDYAPMRAIAALHSASSIKQSIASVVLQYAVNAPTNAVK